MMELGGGELKSLCEPKSSDEAIAPAVGVCFRILEMVTTRCLAAQVRPEHVTLHIPVGVFALLVNFLLQFCNSLVVQLVTCCNLNISLHVLQCFDSRF